MSSATSPPEPGVAAVKADAVLYSSRVEQAMRFAAEKHANQFRKHSAIPYLTHLASVALILSRAGFDDDDVLAAALLHDAVEDAEVSAEELAATFSPRIAALVVAASEVKRGANGEKLSWRTRKEEHLARLRQESVEAQAIVLADKLHNLGTILDDLAVSPETWNRFNAGPDEQRWYYGAVLDAVGDAPTLAPLREEYRRLVDRLHVATDG